MGFLLAVGANNRRGRKYDQPLGRKYFLMLSPSVLNSTLVPRCSRICLVVRLIMPWRLPDCWNFTRPVAVILKRFLAPDLVFSLGILLSSSARQRARGPPWPKYARDVKSLSGCSELSF